MKQPGIPVLFAALSLAALSSCGVKNHPPRPDHIVIVIEENHGYNQVIGTGNAPYINQLAKEGALFTNSHGVTHPSQPNYVAFFSGGLQGIKGDECLKDSTPYTTPNLGASLIKAGYTFAGYSETLPGEGFLECSYEQVKGYSYARKHAPWVNWQGNKENGLPASTNLPLSSFPSDFDSLPTLSFVIPNQGNDMHNTWIDGDTAAIQRADRWLKDHLSRYVDWAKTHNSLLILTFDEDDFTPDNHIPTLFVGPMVQPGEYADSINHYSVLRTLEAMYGLPPAGAAQAAVIKNAWQ
ncbi:alkaline phosphatase family protein [Compostibacter hankyongensis]|uniref:Alkaline phosphatase family protein n=1 Tax=Compostibacter hankyongensis TaxID=1007089 RepID=A0ABP8FNQ3_9BACT